ncbi:hypothetical protein [Polyangium spumosum]|uniref:Uncharacterized protein n=1 Tax=Polyangium spumosum TaxID=889282 RepID=A0A6N7PU55_9BACT|nr:hypothetical protein [Polyangium spumosum]MRG92341.1 hypothetical protein [Polyangium spumosum]
MKKLETFTDRVVALTSRIVQTLFLYAVVVVLVPAFMAVIVVPGIGVIMACTRWVLAAPGGLSWYPMAFGGLFYGVYMLPIAILHGTFARRLSRRVARLVPVRVVEALPERFVAIEAWVVGGRPAPSRSTQDPAKPTPDEWVAYPLVLQDAAGDLLRVERWDGEDRPIDEGAVPYGVVRVGHRVVAVGEVRRDEAGSGMYRVPARGARLVRGKAPYFRVREGDLHELASELHRSETSPLWGISGLVALALGLGAMLGAQSAALSWFP